METTYHLGTLLLLMAGLLVLWFVMPRQWVRERTTHVHGIDMTLMPEDAVSVTQKIKWIRSQLEAQGRKNVDPFAVLRIWENREQAFEDLN